MRIAFVLGIFPALSETFILNQITGLIDRGHEVDIYAGHPSPTSKVHSDVIKYELLKRTCYKTQMPKNRLLRLLKAVGLILVNLHKNPIALLHSLNVFKYGKQAASLNLLYSTIPLLSRKKPYDIIHCHFGAVGILGAYFREIGVLRGKLITTFHGGDVNVVTAVEGTDFYKSLFAKCDLYTINSTFTAGKAIALGCPRDKIVKLPVGVNLAKYCFKERRATIGGAIRILTVARLVEKKGIEFSVRAVAKAMKDYPNLEYNIVGDGPLRESIEMLIGQLGISNKVNLHDWCNQEEIRNLYSEAHIFVLASVTAANGDKEGQGLVLQEAQASGLPIISTLHNGIPEGVLNGRSGFLVPERDVEALAEKLVYLIRHPEIWPEMGRAGRAFVEEHYDINKLNNRLVEIYRELLLDL